MTDKAPPSGWWKRRFSRARWRVEYHFLRDEPRKHPTKAWAACGIYIGGKVPSPPAGPWTRMPPNVTVGKPCEDCIKALEGRTHAS